MVILEAGACGCPTLGTAVGMIPDLEPATRVVSINDEVAFAEALRDLLMHPEKLVEMRQAMLKVVHEKHTLDQMIPQLLALYQSNQ